MITPDLNVLKRFIFGFGSFYIPPVIIICLAIIQYFTLIKHTSLSIGVWVLMFLYILVNIASGWPTGLMVNLVLTLMCIPMTFLIAILLAASRYQRELVVINIISSVLIECVRGVPLIGLMIFFLSIGSDMVPAYWKIPKMITLWLIYSFFAGVYLAEVFRGGFATITKTYFDGADALGLSQLQIYFYILIPKVVIDTMPAAFNVYIGLFKETSLVLLFGYFDLMNMAFNYLDFPENYDQSLNVYAMVLILFWIIATVMHEYGNHLFKIMGIYESKEK